MITKSKLSVSIHDVEFSKDYQYMITAQFQNQKKQTDVSAVVRNPIFTNNTLIFDLPSPHTLQGFIVFVVHMILPSQEGRESSKLNTRVLGECSLDLSPFALQPTQTYNLPIRQQLKFVRSKQGKEITVGRFIASIKMVKQDNLPTHMQQLEVKRLQRNDYFVQLPPFDSKHNFDWRVRVDIREAINIPSTSQLPAQIRVDVGWTQYRDSAPQQNRLFSTTILQGPNPQWNQTILIVNPMHISSPKGFIMISMRDEHNIEDLYRIYIPVESMACFVPYNIKLKKEIEQSPVPMEFYLSLLLQAPLDAKDKLVDIVFQDITFEPAVAPFKQINIAAVIDSEHQPKLQFLTFDSKQDSIERILEFDQAQEFNFILSATMKVPPIKSGNYRAAAVLTLSEAMLRRRINFFLIGKTNKALYKTAGIAQSVQKDLISLLIQKTKKKLFLPVRNQGNAKFGSCQFQIVGPPAKQEQLGQSKLSNRGQQTASEKLMKELNFTTNQSMLRHVAQNNEIIARILRELDDKSESLRQAAAQISDLRGRVKLLQNQNGILRQQALRQEDQLVNLVQREVENMSLRDLKEKIVKISQLYKIQRVKNRELQRTVKAMEPQVSNTMQLNSIIVAQKNNIQTLTDKIQRMNKEHQRIQVYKQTIKKQEKVILKLQTVMKEGMEEVRNARKLRVEYEQLKKKDNVNLGSRTMSRGQDREQIARLQGIIAQLQANNRMASKVDYNDNSSQYQLQFKLHQAQTRISSLENELQQNARTYARQLAMLRMKLAQKEAVMNGFKN